MTFNKKFFWIIILFLLLLVVLPLSFSTPPQASDSGLIVSFPVFNYLDISQDDVFAFQVYRASDGVVMTEAENINCTLHIYDEFGTHIYQNSTTTTTLGDIDYEFDVPHSTFVVGEDYSAQAYCFCPSCGASSQDLGGFARFQFFTTVDGLSDVKHPYGWLPIVIGLALFSFLCFIVSNFVKSDRFEFLRYAFFTYGLINTFFLSLVLFLAVLHPSRVDLAKPVFIAYFSLSGFIIMVILWLFGFAWLGRVSKMVRKLVTGKRGDD